MQEVFSMMLDAGIYAGSEEDSVADEDRETIATNCLQALIYIVASELSA